MNSQGVGARKEGTLGYKIDPRLRARWGGGWGQLIYSDVEDKMI